MPKEADYVVVFTSPNGYIVDIYGLMDAKKAESAARMAALTKFVMTNRIHVSFRSIRSGSQMLRDIGIQS